MQPTPDPGSDDPVDETPGDYGDEGVNLRKWMLMVLERKWYALAVFLVTLIATSVYTFFSTPIYEGYATVQILKHGAQVLRMADVADSSVTSDTDFNTQIKVLESLSMVQNVVRHLSADDLKKLTEPYAGGAGAARAAADIIYQGRKIVPQRFTFIVAIQFRHPNAKVAALVTNLIAQEYIDYNKQLRVAEASKSVDDLKDPIAAQQKKVDDLATTMLNYREREKIVSLESSKDIVSERLRQLNSMATQANSRLEEARVRWSQVQEWQKAGKNLYELPFIASQANVSQLQAQKTATSLAFAQASERYQYLHPNYIAADKAVKQADAELKTALTTAAASIKGEYDNAVQNNKSAQDELAAQVTKSFEVDRASVSYESLEREFQANKEILASILISTRATKVSSSVETESARIIDRAIEPGAPISPKVGLNLAMGALAGLFLGSVIAYGIAAVDNRVKTAFDVETLIGLPLVGVIPKVTGMDQPDKAQIVSNGADPAVIEAFLSLYSTLRMHEASRHAKSILVTSTIPGEGKSFVGTNLALTFASQGQRTVIVDCDLRKPNIQRSFRLRNSKGLVGHCLKGVPLDEVISRDVHPNLDVIIVGGRAKNPIQLLNSKEFELMVAELGKRYDRLIFDTPPLGAVSDALNMLSLMDGAIYTIRYNAVNRQAAQQCVRRLLSANIRYTVYGAVLNGTDTGMTGSYYVEDNAKVFREYFDAGGSRGEASPASPPGRAATDGAT